MAEDIIDKSRDLAKKKIIAILPPNHEMHGEIYNVKLYSCDKEGKNWLYSDVEGLSCLIINYQVKTIYITIYDGSSFEKLFQIELYNNFHKYFEELAPDFRAFEIDSGFLGLKFESEDDATNYDAVIKRLAGLKDDLLSKPRQVEQNSKQNQEKANAYCQKLKEKFTAEEKYDENYAEDGTTIKKHNNFKILSNISYDMNTKQFQFGKISEELKEMFLSFGIKKKDLERDADFAFTLFKKVIVGLGSENKLKNSALDSIEHVFPPPEEREKIRRQEELDEAKMNSLKSKRYQAKKKAPGATKTAANKSVKAKKVGGGGGGGGRVPPPPPPPPPPPSVPGAVPTPVPVAKTETPTTNAAPKEEVNMERELANIKLKKVVKEQPSATDKMIQGTGKNFLQNALSTAIRNRRNNLHMHDDDNDEDEEDDWD